VVVRWLEETDPYDWYDTEYVDRQLALGSRSRTARVDSGERDFKLVCLHREGNFNTIT